MSNKEVFVSFVLVVAWGVSSLLLAMEVTYAFLHSYPDIKIVGTELMVACLYSGLALFLVGLICMKSFQGIMFMFRAMRHRLGRSGTK